MVKRYPAALKDSHCEEGHEGLAVQLARSVDYLNRRQIDNAKTSEPQKKRAKFTKKQMYGIDANQFRPASLPAEKTEEMQAKKEALLAAFKRHPVDYKKVAKDMKDTFVAQRDTVVHRNLIVEAVLKEWPFLGKVSPLFYVVYPCSVDVVVTCDLISG